jgi:hypothetical protein
MLKKRNAMPNANTASAQIKEKRLLIQNDHRGVLMASKVRILSRRDWKNGMASLDR